MKTKSCFILGFPFAGKTTFLAALSYSLQQRGIHTKLSLESFSGDQSYLSSLTTKWLKGEEMIRTFTPTQKELLSVKLKDEEDNIFDLEFPDFSGEIFNKFYIERELNPALAEKMKKSDAFLLFINPEKIVEPENISSIPYDLRYENKETTETTETSKTIKRDPIENDSTAAKLVELLQFVEFIYEKEKIILFIVISAWDLVNSKYQSPQECVEKRLPMLWQYMTANSDVFHIKYFGISAQGDKLSDSNAKEEELEKHIENLLVKYEKNPAERIQVLDEFGKKCNDITMPLWDMLSII